MTFARYILLFFIFTSSLFFPHPLSSQTRFIEVSQTVGISHHYKSPTYMGGGAAFLDIDNDGDEDVWINGGLNPDALFRNDGQGSFTDISDVAGLNLAPTHVSTGVLSADLDNDGFRDVLVLPHIGFAPLLFRNKGNSTFSLVPEAGGLSSYLGESLSAAFGDVNKDGLLDIYLARYIDQVRVVKDSSGTIIGFDHDCFENLLFINQGDWTFVEAGNTWGVSQAGCTLAATFTDVDGDADADLLVANDFGQWIVPNTLYKNEYPRSGFTNISQPSGMDVGIFGMGIAIGDYDRDLDLDYYVSNLGRNILMEQQDSGFFLDKASEAGVEDIYMDSLLATGWGTAFLDVDNDTDLDLFVCNGFVPGADFIANSRENKHRLFIQDRNTDTTGFMFTEMGQAAGLDDGAIGRGFAYADYDNDGDLDILVVNLNPRNSSDPLDNIRLYKNETEHSGNWLKVKLKGISSNRDAFGATLKIVADSISWLHDYNGGQGSHASQHSSIAHFGLGNSDKVDSLIVQWPSGTKSYHTDLPANQFLHIREDGRITGRDKLSFDPKNLALHLSPNPFSQKLHLAFTLQKSSNVQIEIFDGMGRKVSNIVEAWYPPGEHHIYWEPDKSHPFSGWGFVRLSTEKEAIMRKIIRGE